MAAALIHVAAACTNLTGQWMSIVAAIVGTAWQ